MIIINQVTKEFGIEGMQFLKRLKGLQSWVGRVSTSPPKNYLTFFEKGHLPTHFLLSVEWFLVLPTHIDEASNTPGLGVPGAPDYWVHYRLKVWWTVISIGKKGPTKGNLSIFKLILCPWFFKNQMGKCQCQAYPPNSVIPNKVHSFATTNQCCSKEPNVWWAQN